MDVMRAYATLGVTPTATWDELRHAYHAALFGCHPDTGAGDVRALQSLTDAYHELSAVHPRARPDTPGAERRRHLDVYA